MVFWLEHDIKVTKSHQNLLPTQSVIVVHTVQCKRTEQNNESCFHKNNNAIVNCQKQHLIQLKLLFSIRNS
jgi:hypothetical protein